MPATSGPGYATGAFLVLLGDSPCGLDKWAKWYVAYTYGLGRKNNKNETFLFLGQKEGREMNFVLLFSEKELIFVVSHALIDYKKIL